jgi:hypothetical protein
VEEIREKKAALQQVIRGAVESFEVGTGVEVVGIDWHRDAIEYTERERAAFVSPPKPTTLLTCRVQVEEI